MLQPELHPLHPFRLAAAAVCTAALALLAACNSSIYKDPDRPGLIENPNLLGPNVTAEIVYGQFFIGPEDRLRFDFMRHNDYDGSFQVRGDGRLYLHDLGLVDVMGLTVDELQDLLTTRYNEILVNPSVYVEVESFSSRRKIAVQGYVDKPGVFALQNPRTTIFEALALAGGVDKSEGDRGAVLLARRVEGRIQVARYDEAELFSPSDPNARYEIPYVQDGDYIYVLRSWGAEFDEQVDRYTDLLRGVTYLERVIIGAEDASDALQGDADDPFDN